MTRSTKTTARVIWDTLLSLDGYIAGADDEMQWANGVDDFGGSTADDVVVLGENVARQCVEAGHLDEIIVHIAPVLVGDGIRFSNALAASRSNSSRSRPWSRAIRPCSATALREPDGGCTLEPVLNDLGAWSQRHEPEWP